MKYTGNFTAAAGKVLKSSENLYCRTDSDGAVYVTNGCIAYKMYPVEYSAVVQPVSCCEAGNWSIKRGNKSDESGFDLVRIFNDAVSACKCADVLEPCPLTLNTSKKGVAAATYYNAAADFVALYDTRYIAALAPGFTLRSPNATAPAVAYSGDEPFALVLPIRPDNDAARAVKAYFAQSAGDSSKEAKQLRSEIDRLYSELDRAESDAAVLRERAQQQAAEIETLRAAADHSATAGDSAPDTAPAAPSDAKTAAEIIAARFACMDGVTTTIKGAHTTAPVVWLSGNTDEHTNEIEAAGAKWSGKKSAYYVRVA